MANPDEDVDDEWPVTWQAHGRAQLREIAALTPEQRLEWLEEAIELAYRSGALALARDRGQEG